jgi:hypothetical protein
MTEPMRLPQNPPRPEWSGTPLLPVPAKRQEARTTLLSFGGQLGTCNTARPVEKQSTQRPYTEGMGSRGRSCFEYLPKGAKVGWQGVGNDHN